MHIRRSPIPPPRNMHLAMYAASFCWKRSTPDIFEQHKQAGKGGQNLILQTTAFFFSVVIALARTMAKLMLLSTRGNPGGASDHG